MSEIAIKTEKPDVSSDEVGLGASPTTSMNSSVVRRQEPTTKLPSMRAVMRAAAVAAATANRNPPPAQKQQQQQQQQQFQRKTQRTQQVAQQLPPPPKLFLPGARCGEIFVANNARQWTFICTFCNKSTRDIGDFICHIKMKHLQESDYAPTSASNSAGSGGGGSVGYYDDAEHNDDVEDFGQQQHDQLPAEEQDVRYNNYSNVNKLRVSGSRAIEIIPIQAPPREMPLQRQTVSGGVAAEYLDCSSYLDVNVHTEPDELSFNGDSLQQTSSTAKKRPIASGNKFAKKSTASAANRNPRENFVVVEDVNDEDNNDNNEQEATSAAPPDYDENDIEQNITTHTSRRAAGDRRVVGGGTSQNYANANGGRKPKTEAAASLDYDDFDYSDEQYPHAADELRHYNQNSTNFDDDDGGGDNDYEEDDDFDNQLLIAPGADDSLEELALNASLGTTGSLTADGKRRQIRGTAYCALCNKTFQYYSLYRNHMIKHSNDTPYKCVLCKKGFKSKQAIRYHMHTHQKEKKYQCQLCHHGYYTENQFITHVLTHENASTFPCMVCGQILRSDKERDAHLATHTEERPFRCEFCNKLFRLRHHLSNHLKMHRQYKCDWCRAEFTSAIHLRKPYACPMCEQLPEVRSNVAQKHRASASNSLDADPSSAGADSLVNPLHLFETVEPPTECVDLAEMVSDSDEAENEPLKGNDDDDDDDEEEDEADEDDEEDLTGENHNSRSNSYLTQQYGSGGGGRSAASVQPDRKRLTCKYCQRSYSHLSGLNYHIRMKHR